MSESESRKAGRWYAFLLGAGLCAFGAAPTVDAHDILAQDSGTARAASGLADVLASEPIANPARFALFSIFSKRLIWPPGRSPLSVCFWNGTEEMRRRVLTVAAELTAGLPITFFGQASGPASACTEQNWLARDIRVSLQRDPNLLAASDDPDAFFSVIGNASRNDSRRATVNLPFAENSDENFMRGKILHEFCHALGCLHEHQRDVCSAEFDLDAIRKSGKMSEKEIEKNLLNIPNSNVDYEPITIGDFDIASVMLYTFKEWMFRDPKTAKCYRANPVSALSQGDKRALTYMYGAARMSGLPETLEELLAKPTVLAASANELRHAARQLRVEDLGRTTEILRGGDTARRSRVETILDARAKQLIERANALDAEAESYRLRPETVEKLREMMRAP